MEEPAKKTILVVEDDPILKNLLVQDFTNKYQAVYARNGKEALQMFEEHKPALVLLDLIIPEVNGFDVLAAIRARTDDTKNTPVIVVSNLGQGEDIEKAKTIGANDYLIKAEVAIEDIGKKIDAFVGA